MTNGQRPLHVCYVISKLGVGGAEKNLLLLAANLPRDQYAPVVLSLNGEGEYAGQLRRAGVPVYSLGFPSPIYIWRGARLFWRCSFDLFHGFMFHGNLAARLFALFLGKPCVSAVRVAEGEKKWHLWLDRWTSNLVSWYTTNSLALRDFVRLKLHVPDERISVIPNALSEEDRRPPPDRVEALYRLNVPETTAGQPTFLVAMVGRLHIQKDPETFVRAARRLVATHDRVRFLIAGIGPLQSRIETLIRESDLEDCIHLVGLAPSRDVYAACDVFVLPSRWEGFPNAAIEAMAAGKPVVLSDFDGAAEVVDYGVTGLVFPRGDDRALAESLTMLIQNEQLRSQMGHRAQEKVLATYTIGQLVGKNMELYDRLTATS